MQYVRQNFRVYPTNAQDATINQWLGNARWTWNHFLEKNIERYEEEKKFIFAHEMVTTLPGLKGLSETDWLKLSPSQTLQGKCRTLDTALKRSFKKQAGFPKFKSKNSDCSGIAFPQGWHFNGNRINLPKLKGLKIKIHRDMSHAIAGELTLKRDRVGDCWVSILYKVAEFAPPPSVIKHSIGIDVGLKEFAVTSDAEIIDNPKFMRRSKSKLKRVQRVHSHKTKGSNNKEKSRIRLARAHRKIARQRKDFINKIACSIAKNNDAVFVEDLNIKGMMQNHKLAGAIADVGWGMFIETLQWQCKKHSSHFVKIGRWFPSSKTCSACGWKDDALSLVDRTFNCKSCETKIDRDFNAAINIHNEGINVHIRQGLSKSKPLERTPDIISDADLVEEGSPAPF